MEQWASSGWSRYALSALRKTCVIPPKHARSTSYRCRRLSNFGCWSFLPWAQASRNGPFETIRNTGNTTRRVTEQSPRSTSEASLEPLNSVDIARLTRESNLDLVATECMKQ